MLDLCGHTDCLIADRDGVYDASSVNGRLLLGLKGQISELELHILRGRLSVAEIDLAADALAEVDRRRDELLFIRRQEVERLHYQERLAQRQYQHTDPENRPVAAELEKRWEAVLRELKETEEKLAHEEQNTPCWALPEDLIKTLKELGPRFPQLRKEGPLRWSQKKALLRCLMDKVVLHRVAADQVRTRVVWRGGAITSDDVPVSVGSFARLSGAKEMEESILRMAREGRTDQQIAECLTSHGCRSPQCDVVLPNTVRNIRLKHRILLRTSQSHPRRVPGHLTVPQLAEKLEIPCSWIYDRIHNRTIRVQKDANTKCYLFPDKSLDRLRGRSSRAVVRRLRGYYGLI